MAIDTTEISREQRDIVFATEENHFADVKSIDIAPAKLSRTVAAFANADGGELYIGIDEVSPNKSRVWRGFADPEAANGHIQAIEGLFPLGADLEFRFLRCDGETGLVLRVEIRKTRDIKRASNGEPYVRRGAQNQPVTTPEAMKQLEYAKGLSSFETEVLNVPHALVTNSIPMLEFMLNVVPTAEPEAWLTKQLLLRDNRPAVAGAILFAEEPQALVPKHCGIKLYRYRTRDAQGSRETLAFDPITIEGHAYSQIHDAVGRTVSIIEEIQKLGEATLEAITYPPETLHEIITNAVLHRDYSVADDIHIRVFDNRVEVQSPGRLPAHVTVRNILDERFARNGIIVRLINKFPNPPNKDVGEGLNTAFAAMTNLGLKAPTIDERDNSVVVTIRHESLASPEALILEYLATNPTIRNKVAREICHIPADYIIKDIFGRLVERGLIQKVEGTARATTAYEQGPKYAEWRKAQERPT